MYRKATLRRMAASTRTLAEIGNEMEMALRRLKRYIGPSPGRKEFLAVSRSLAPVKRRAEEIVAEAVFGEP